MKTAMIAMLLQTVASPEDVPLAPVGKWTVEYADAACVLSHDFGAVGSLITVGFAPSPLGDYIELVTIKAGAASAKYKQTKGRVTLQPSGRTIDSVIRIFGIKASNKTVTTINADGQLADALKTTTAITVEFDDQSRQSFAVPGMSKAFAALRTCQTDLLKGWGIDPLERDRIKKPPEGAPANWVTTDDYPTDALSAHRQGTSYIVWAVDLKGRVVDCRIVQSSGTKSLDDAACRGITLRGRYRPAIGMDDKPMVSHQSRKIFWILPE